MSATQFFCEDEMEQLYGIRHYAAFMSTLPMMLVPLNFMSKVSGLSLECKIYSIVLLFLFLQASFEHAGTSIGSWFPLVQTSGMLHSMILSAVTFREWNDRKQKQNLEKSQGFLTKPSLISCFIYALCAVVLMNAYVLQLIKEETVVAVLDAPFALCAVASIGIMSYRQQKLKQTCQTFFGYSAWTLWKWACVALFAVTGLLEGERYLCSFLLNQQCYLIARLFHAVVVHGWIVVLFGSVSECVLLLLTDNKAKMTQSAKKVD